MGLFKRQIARGWKASYPPAIQEWVREVHKWTKVEADVVTQMARQRDSVALVTIWDTYVFKMAEKANPVLVTVTVLVLALH